MQKIYSTPLSIGEIETEIKKMRPTGWSRFLYMKDLSPVVDVELKNNRFVLRSTFLTATGLIRQGATETRVNLDVDFIWTMKIAFVMAFVIFSGLLWSGNAKINGEVGTWPERIAFFAFGVFVLGVFTFIMKIEKKGFAEKIIDRLKLKPAEEKGFLKL